MKKLFLSFVMIGSLSALYSNCSQHGFEVASESVASSTGAFDTTTPAAPNGTIGAPSASDTNTMKITMGCGYVNEPCVSVTICSVGTNTCQTIPNILLDTGSYGLRIFSSKISVALSALNTSGGQPIGECMSYLDGTSQWGPVKQADILMGQERASKVPIQVIDASFAKAPADCTDLDSPGVGYNGILGVGVFTDDCGSSCANSAGNKVYYSCAGTTCTGIAMPIAYQVSNPVSFLPLNNNGVIVSLPAIADAGAVTATGTLIMGIGKQPNNTPVSGITFFQADGSGNFKTNYNGKTYNGFIDSGSNGLFFPKSANLSNCTASFANGFFCPASQLALSATQIGSGTGGTQKAYAFNIANGEAILSTSNSNMVFNNLGGDLSSDFDWGLPFFLGRTVFVGISGKTSSLGTGPYWAH